MKILLGLFAAGALMSTAASPAWAAWMHLENEDAFSEVTTHISFSEAGGYSLGFRCTTPGDLVLIYFTPETVDDDAISAANAFSPKVLVRVDQESSVTLASELNNETDGEVGAISGDAAVANLVKNIATAESRVAVTIEVGGDRFHTFEFDAIGSTKAIEQLVTGCSIV